MRRSRTALIAAAAALGLACGSSRQTTASAPEPVESETGGSRMTIVQISPAEVAAGAVVPVTGRELLPPAARPIEELRKESSCPMSLDSVQVQVIQHQGTTALEFSAEPQYAEYVRSQAAGLATLYQEAAGARDAVPLYSARFEPTVAGGRIVFTATHPEDRGELETDVIEHAAAMQDTGLCPVR